MKHNKIFIFFMCYVFFNVNAVNAQKLNIAVAANVYTVSKIISSHFTKQTGIKVNIISSSSGKLYRQIINGAPYHIFISGDMMLPNELTYNNHGLNLPKVYAKGVLVLWFNKNVPLKKFEDLASIYNKYVIAIANSNTAPYGKAAIEALHNIQIYNNLQPNLVIAESINHINHLIATNNVDIAFTSKSALFSEELKDKGNFIEIPPTYYNEILQGVILLKYAQKNQYREANLFYEYFFSNESKTLLRKYGYIII